MKNNLKTTFHILLLLTFFLGHRQYASGQEKINIITGIGMPELIHIGARYQLEQIQIGLTTGYMLAGSNEKLISITSDGQYHFAGQSDFARRRPWYAKMGIHYLRNETEKVIDKYVYLNTRIGRDFNLSKKIGLAIDAGAIFELSKVRVRKKPPTNWSIDINFPVLPSFGIGLFYRI